MAVASSAVAAERGGPRHGGLEASLRATIGWPEAAVLGDYSGARRGPTRGARRRRGDRHAGCGPAWASSAATTRLPHRTRRKICNPFIFNMLQDILGDRVQFRAQFAVGLKRTSLAVRGLWTGGPVDRPGMDRGPRGPWTRGLCSSAGFSGVAAASVDQVAHPVGEYGQPLVTRIGQISLPRAL